MRKLRTTTKLLAIGARRRRRRRCSPPPAPAIAAKKQSRAGHAPARLLPQRHPRAGDRRRRERHLRQEARHERHPRAARRSTRAPRRSQAFQAEALDASYIGPSPTITAWTQFDKGVKIVSGAASGGAYFVVNPTINSAADLKGKIVASPAARQHPGRRAAHVAEEEGTQHRHHRRRRRVDPPAGQRHHARTRSRPATSSGAWVPEPWATRLVTEGGGKILVDEADLWPKGQYVTTQLIVTTELPQGRTPTSCRSWSTGRSRRTTTSRPTRRRRRRSCRTGHRRRSPASRSPVTS